MSGKMFNNKIKNMYIRSIELLGNRHVIKYFLLKTSKEERQKNKDAFNMTLEELETLLYSLAPSTELSSYHNLLRLMEYIQWAIDKGLSVHKESPLGIVEDKGEYSKKFVSYYKRSVFTREKLFEMMNELVNREDRVLLLLLFEGVKGKDYSEIVNLKLKHMSLREGVYYLLLKNDAGDYREISISNELAEMLWESDKSLFYINKNGAIDRKSMKVSEYQESAYVFKKAKRGKQSGKLDSFFIQRKFSLYKEVFDMRFLNPRQIINSGIMHYANELYKQFGRIGGKQYDMIGERFDVSIIEKDGYVYRNTTVIRRVLRMPEFEELYGYRIID